MATHVGTTTESMHDEGVAAAVAHDARAGAASVADTAKDQARNVGGQLQDHARTVVGDATSELEHQLDERLRRMTGMAHERKGQLQALADGRTDEAGPVTDWARTAADQIGQLAERVESLGPRGVAEEAANFARRRPLAFLAGAAAAGFVVGRLARNASRSQNGGPSQNGGGNGTQQPEIAAAPVGSVIGPGSTGV